MATIIADLFLALAAVLAVFALIAVCSSDGPLDNPKAMWFCRECHYVNEIRTHFCKRCGHAP